MCSFRKVFVQLCGLNSRHQISSAWHTFVFLVHLDKVIFSFIIDMLLILFSSFFSRLFLQLSLNTASVSFQKVMREKKLEPRRSTVDQLDCPTAVQRADEILTFHKLFVIFVLLSCSVLVIYIVIRLYYGNRSRCFGLKFSEGLRLT